MSGADGEARTRRSPLLRWLVLAGVVLALLAGGIVWWVDQGRHRFFPKNWGVVEEGRLYRSGRIHRAIVEDVLRTHEIDLIVDLAANDADDPDEIAEREAAARLGIRKVDLAGLDGYGTGDLQDYAVGLKETLEALDRGERVLLHCAGGSERTGAAVAWYRMLVQGWDGVRAWEEYTRYRLEPPERPNLPEYVDGNLEELVARLRRLGVSVDVPDPRPRFGPEGDEAP